MSFFTKITATHRSAILHRIDDRSSFLINYLAKSNTFITFVKEIKSMSPKLFTIAGYIFHFHSREESRIHVHVMKAEHETKIWMEPKIEVAENFGFSTKELSTNKSNGRRT